MMEFHISRQARDRYQFDQSLFSTTGTVIFANFHAVRVFAQKINQQRDLVNFPERAAKSGEINALGLMDEIMHHVLALYRRQKNAEVLQQAAEYLSSRLGPQSLERALRTFAQEFPPLAVYTREQTLDEWFEGQTEGLSNRQAALEEMLLLWVTNQNTAAQPYQELFDDGTLAGATDYSLMMRELRNFFETQPPFGPQQQNLIDMLRAPALAHPNSLTAQLDFIREQWFEVLGQYLYRLLSSIDLLKEEAKAASFGQGPGPVPIPVYGPGGNALTAAGEIEYERFSQDREWMPRLVMIAKNSFVWLDQLSRQYGREIRHLDQIPDEELDDLARSGFSGLWLIGLWERSRASARIKQLTGNPDAVASAYSLAGYNIAWDLGGEEAYRNLRDRAWQRGIRLASDMVPNHMGIDSSWVMDHPDWFLSLNYSPFPSYSFNGENLSGNDRVGVFLEDHYFDRTDAAVVFKRVDFHSGDTRYVYHGNDGTSMPWNDTAQLNYLNPEVREAVIQTILHVARMFPIIRFDAAMTLAKKHVQRLWFPEPGTGGAIPSRAEYGMSKEQFDQLMPHEFWREVVDRAAVEAPDTLLLAEAFWMMEGYFVRTLGMHRVYNSAFMNLLRNEENAKYRELMKNTLEFDPEILKRHVNFMNNPDERTAVDQFGKGDKYFGICMLMSTMPGLPMFGHGQVQGFSEKYGMEFRRALWDEQPDPWLIERHQREIFPLLHRRAEFAGVEDFLLYDFFTPEGGVDENVYAYSNSQGGHHNLVVYHNRFGSTRGWIRTSAGYMDKAAREIRQRTLGEGLGLQPGENTYVIFRDHISGMQFLAHSMDLAEKGMYLELQAYKYHVFVDFQQVEDDQSGSFRQLHSYLQGRGVPDVRTAQRELLLQPVQDPLRQIINPGYLGYLIDSRLDAKKVVLPPGLLEEARKKMSDLLDGIAYLTAMRAGREKLTEKTALELERVLALPVLEKRYPLPGSRLYPRAAAYLLEGLEENPGRWLALLTYVFTHNLGSLAGEADAPNRTLSWFDEWQVGRLLAGAAQEMGLSEEEASRVVRQVKLLISQQGWYEDLGDKPLDKILESWLAKEEVRAFLGVNRFKDVLWFNHEAFTDFVWWMLAGTVLEALNNPRMSAAEMIERLVNTHEFVLELQTAEAASGYQVEKLLAAVKAPVVEDEQKEIPAE